MTHNADKGTDIGQYPFDHNGSLVKHIYEHWLGEKWDLTCQFCSERKPDKTSPTGGKGTVSDD